MAANGDKVFSAITGKGTFTRTTAHSTETDTITGGTGRFAGASGTYTDTISYRRRLDHIHKPDKPRHRCCPRTDPLLGQIGPGGLYRPSLASSRQLKRARPIPRSGGFGYDQAIHPASRTGRHRSGAVSG